MKFGHTHGMRARNKLRVFILGLMLGSFNGVTYAGNKSWEIDASFEQLGVGEKAKGESGFQGLAGQSEIVMSPALQGKAAKLWVKKGQTGYGRWGGDWKFPERAVKGDTLTYSANLYFPDQFDYFSYGEGERLKVLRIQTKSSKGKNLGYIDLYINRQKELAPLIFIYEGEQKWVRMGEPADQIAKDKWVNLKIEATLDDVPIDEGGKAEVKVWKDNKLLAHITDRKTLKFADAYADRALLFTYWNGGAPKDQFMFVDEIKIRAN